MHSATIFTPTGPFTVLAAGEVVYASGWTDDPAALLALVHPSLRPTEVEPRRHLGPVTEAVEAYLDGVLEAPSSIAVLQRSGPFLEHAWDVLRKVEPGETVTYAELAARAGNPAAARAAASACARNAAALFVPCHRVLRTGEGLGGFRWGLDVKRWLLAHEAPDPAG